MRLLFKLLARIGLVQTGPSVTGITSATQTEGTSLVHTVTLASAVTGTPGLYPFAISSVTASTPSDYSATPTFSNSVTRSGNTLTVPVGVSTFTVTVPTSQDTVFEGAETYSITVGAMNNTGTINDDEVAPTITSVSGVSATEGSPLVHTVAISGTAQAARTYAISLVGVTATGGGTDFTSTLSNGMFSNGVTVSGGNISVPAGVTGFTVTVSTADDAVVESSETYTLTIGGASGTGTITDNDFAAPNVSSVSTATQTEGTSLVHTVTLSAAVAGVSAVYPFSISSVTASTPSDYAATPTFSNGVTLSGGNITVPVGVSSFTATVATSQDTVYEGAETYSISVNGVSATGTINDDESAPTVTSVSSASATEGGNIVHTVTITGTAQAAQTYSLTLSGGTATGGGTDYTSTLTNGAFSNGVTISGGTITVPAGVTSFTVTVPTTADVLVEGNETYTLAVGGASGTGTIIDHDLPSFTFSLGSFVNATGGGVTNVFITGGGGSSLITPSIVTNRISGVAPLYVHFDASGTVAPAWTSRPFHDLEYEWSFGDPGSGNWANGARAEFGAAWSKNQDFGPVAAHVFETPGTYTVTLNVRHDLDEAAPITVTITVADPNVVFSGANTICIANGSTPVPGVNGVPAGAVCIDSGPDPYSVYTANLAAGKRILFKRGDTFTIGTQMRINVNGPGIVGAYGTGADPIFVNANNFPAFNIGSPTNSTIFSDWRMMDLDIHGQSTLGSMAIYYGAPFTNVLMHRVHVDACQGGFASSISVLNQTDGTVWDSLGFNECTFFQGVGPTNGGGNGMYLASTRLAVIGCHIDPNQGGEHGFRSGFSVGAVVTHNSVINVVAGKANISMRCGGAYNEPAPGPIMSSFVDAETGCVTARNCYVADNYTRPPGGAGSQVTAVGAGPLNQLGVGRWRNVLIERNFLLGAQIGIMCCDEATVRSNIILAGDTSVGSIFPQVGLAEINTRFPFPNNRNCRYYNNSFYGASTQFQSEFFALAGEARPGNVEVRNNLAYEPFTANDWYSAMFYPLPLTNPADIILTESNNTLITQMKSVNPYSVAAPTTPAQFAPVGYAVGGGTPVPVWSDFFGVRVTGATRDIGAVKS